MKLLEIRRPTRARGQPREQRCVDLLAGEARQTGGSAGGMHSAVNDLDQLSALLEPGTSDLLVNPDGTWVERDGMLAPIGWRIPEERRQKLARALAARAGKRLDLACPIADGALELKGTHVRLHAVIPPIAATGTLISLRAPALGVVDMGQLRACGTVNAAQESQLRHLVESRANLIISGGTGSGKTTLLGALLGLVPTGQRIVCIEQDLEIQARHPHLVRLAERAPNLQGAGAITLAQLVTAAMRMRPDRIVLGECRGPEVGAVLSAMNTGHDGSMATVHANSAEDVPARLQALAALGGLDPRVTQLQIAAGLDTIVHLERNGLQRRVAQIQMFKNRPAA